MPRSLRGHADVSQFRALAGKTSQLSPKLRAGLRRNIRNVGQSVVTAMRVEVEQPPLSGGNSGRHTGLRDDIAQNIRITIATGNRAGVVITSGLNNQAHPRGLTVGYGKPKGFRHPIPFADAWAPQMGRAYFYPVAKLYRDRITRQVNQAMQDAANTLK